MATLEELLALQQELDQPQVVTGAPVGIAPAAAQPNASLDELLAIQQELDVPTTTQRATGRSARARQLREEREARAPLLPEVGAAEELNEFTFPAFKASIGLMLSGNAKGAKSVLQEQFPEATFEIDAEGNDIVSLPSGKFRVRGLAQTAAGIVAQGAPFLKGAQVAQIATRGVGLGARALTQAGTAAGIQTGIEAGEQALGGEAISPGTIALAGGLGGLAEVAGPAIAGIRTARQARRAGVAREELAQVAPQVAAAQEATEQTGIPLFQAQQTGIPSQLERQSFVAQLPAGTKSAVDGLKSQNQAAGDAVENFLADLAPPEAIITGAERVRTAAQGAVDKVKNIRTEAASPLFDDAFAQGANVDLAPVRDLINSKLKDLPPSGEIARSIKKAARLIGDGQPSLKQLQKAKIEMDQMLAKFGTTSLGNTTKAELTQVKNALLDQMNAASPSYAAANRAFAEASPAVTQIQDSIIGKIANISDDQLKNVSSRVFDPAQTNPQVVAAAKKAITDIDPGAWNQIARVELEKRLGSIKSTAEAGTLENIPGQLFRAIFPNEKNTKVLFNALDSEAKKNLRFLQTALGRARLGRPGGSQTAAREEIKRELRGGIAQTIQGIFREPLNTIRNIGDDTLFNNRTRTLAKMMFDPTWKAEMAKLRTFKSNTPAAAKAFAQLFNEVGATDSAQNP